MTDVDNNNQENESAIEYITISMIAAAYKLYEMKKISCIQADDFILSNTAKNTWSEPLNKYYTTFKSKIIDAHTQYTCIELLHNLKSHQHNIANKLIKNISSHKVKAQAKTSLIQLTIKLVIIYYNIVFDDDFKHKIISIFEANYLDKHVISLEHEGAKITQGIFMYQGKVCIECKGKLSIVYRGYRRDTKGSIAMVYHKHKAPKIANVYQQRCQKCDIYYNYNRIDYTKNSIHISKQNTTIFLDPSKAEYFSISQKTNNIVHRSILQSIKHHQYCNKPTSIEIWLQHYNEEWADTYISLQNDSKTSSLSHQLGYKTILRYFYFYSALLRIRDITDYGSININGRNVKIAMIFNDEDKRKMYDEANYNQDRAGDEERSEKYRESTNFLKYSINKFYNKLLSADTPELEQVPIQMNNNGDVQIYPGWFVLYGDGGEHIKRIRCAYPSILAKHDCILSESNHNNNNNQLNEIGQDDNIDLIINHNSRLYTKTRYYECDNSPQTNSSENNRKSYKTCKYHTQRLANVYNLPLQEISTFITWYSLFSAIGRIKNTKIKETLTEHYTIDDEVVKSIKSKQKKKLERLQNKIAKFIDEHKDKHIKYKKFILNIQSKIPTYKQARACTSKGRARTQQALEASTEAAIAERIHEILGDDDGELDTDHFKMTIDARDLLDLEFKNNNYLNKMKGCRKANAMTPATICKTKGLNVLMNCAGMMVKLTEEVVRETPTSVILDIADACTINQSMIQYSNRIEAIGYDMMCRIYYHLKTLLQEDRLSAKYATFWSSLMERAFIDIWHIFTHTDFLCSEQGIFHPKLKKFRNILYNISQTIDRINDIIAEQFWSTMNATSQLMSMGKETFLLFLLEKKSYHNQIQMKELQKQGWKFIPIKWCTKLRDIESDEVELKSEAELQENNNKQLSRVQIKADKLQAVKDMFQQQSTTSTNINRYVHAVNNQKNGCKNNRKRKLQSNIINDSNINKSNLNTQQHMNKRRRL